ncbi:MAG: hypothetical protein MZU97_01620 [Bacillus subtilis]|nr:hypothetical protein [Bacillus subtilis]
MFPQERKHPAGKGSVAYKILNSILLAHQEWFNSACSFDFIKEWENKFYPLYTPMNYSKEGWEIQADAIIQEYEKEKIIGFVTLGDAAIYSSAYYLLDIIKLNRPLFMKIRKLLQA